MRTRTARIMRIIGHPLLKAFCRLLARVVPLAFAERTKNAQFLPAWKQRFPPRKGHGDHSAPHWCRRSGANRRPAAYKAAALPLSYGGDGADCTPARRCSGLSQFSLTFILSGRDLDSVPFGGGAAGHEEGPHMRRRLKLLKGYYSRCHYCPK